MNNLYDKQNELEEIITGIDNIVDSIKDKYYIDMLNELKYEAQTELEEIEGKIEEQEEKEIQEENILFERSKF